MKTIPLAVAGFALVLAGCDPVSDTITEDEFGEAIDAYNTYYDALYSGNLKSADLPNSGTVTYSGAIEIYGDTSNSTSVGMLGRMSVTADFGASSISGEASGFAEIEPEIYEGEYFEFLGDSVDGTLDLVNGVITNSSSDFDARLVGTLATGSEHERDINSAIRGDFSQINGSSVVYVVGRGFGTSTTNGSANDIRVYFLTDDH